jgi:hypothetical protein
VVKLIDVYPGDAPDPSPNPQNVRMGGFQMLLAGDILRAKFRNSMSAPEPMVPNQPAKLQFTLGDKYHTFLKRHRVMVQVQSSWFPMFDRNPQTVRRYLPREAGGLSEGRAHRVSIGVAPDVRHAAVVRRRRPSGPATRRRAERPRHAEERAGSDGARVRDDLIDAGAAARAAAMMSTTLAQRPANAPATAPAGKAPDSVFIEDLTWAEVRDLVKAGTTTVIIGTAGTEQKGRTWSTASTSSSWSSPATRSRARSARRWSRRSSPTCPKAAGRTSAATWRSRARSRCPTIGSSSCWSTPAAA